MKRYGMAMAAATVLLSVSHGGAHEPQRCAVFRQQFAARAVEAGRAMIASSAAVDVATEGMSGARVGGEAGELAALEALETFADQVIVTFKKTGEMAVAIQTWMSCIDGEVNP